MTPDQAWQATLAQLQMEMPKATFDTWVREARLLAVEGEIFTVEVANAYIREWLENRLSSTIRRILSGILNQPVEIHFVVISSTFGEIQETQQIQDHPEAAWEAVFSHVETRLQTAAGKSNFERFLRGACYLGYERNCFTIGVPTSEAHQWVEATMTETIKRMLSDLMRKPVEVQFILIPPPVEEISTPQDNKHEETVPERRIPEGEAEILIKPIRLSLYEIIARPKSVVVIPAYFLRWLPYLGPDKGWFLCAMRQVFYQTYGKRLSPANCGQTFTVNRKRLARWAGMGERRVRQFMRELENHNGQGNFLAWFMQCRKGEPGFPNLFTFRADMPLTPPDVEALSTWLTENGIEENPVATLKTAVEKQPRELLSYPVPPMPAHHRTLKPNPCTVQEVILTTARVPKTSPKYLPLKQLADELQQHLQSPADNLILTHYFLLEWVQKLGTTPAWVITILRDRGFIDHHAGIRRDRIKLAGGYKELAQLLKVSERQIRDWLPALEDMIRRRKPPLEEAQKNSAWEKRQVKRKLVGYFLEKSAQIGWQDQRQTTYEFKVKLEDPLTPEHQEIHERLEQCLYDGLSRGNLSDLEWLVEEFGDLGCARSSLAESWYANDPSPQEADTQMIQPPTGLVRVRSMPRSADDPGQAAVDPRMIQLKALLIKHLYPKARLEIKHLLQQYLAEFRQRTIEPTNSPSGEWEQERVWNWEKLLGYGGLAPEVRRQILQNPIHQTQFLAQVLYGFENKASGTRTGIKAPFKFAAKHWHESPLPEYMELARLSPCQLAGILEDWQEGDAAVKLSFSARGVLDALRENEFFRILEDATRVTNAKGLTQEILKKVG